MSRRVLVVDDEQGIRGALGQLLEYEGYEVRTAANAVDGIAEYERWRPHLTLARVRERTPSEALRALSLAARTVSFRETIVVQSIDLMQSELGKGGSRYVLLSAAPLRGA